MTKRSFLLCSLALALVPGCSSKPAAEEPITNSAPEAIADAAPPPAAGLGGTYRTTKTVMIVCEKPDWCEQEVDDFLRVTEAGKDLNVYIELVQANAHTCTFEGRLTPVVPSPAEKASVWEHRAAGEYPCHLLLEKKGDQVNLSSEGCREHCGARAHLMGEFRFPPADPDPTAFSCEARCASIAACDASIKDIDCKAACWNLEGTARDTFDDCVREAADDCPAMLACRK